MTCLTLLWLMLIPLLPFLLFVLFMLLCRDAIHVIMRRWASSPIWTPKDDTEVRDLMG
jgi:hypothetical protein